MQLPNWRHATIDRRKLRDYVLNPAHPEGRHKARVFLSALGLTAADSEWLATMLLQHLGAAEAVLTDSTPWGELYRVDQQIWRGSRCARVRTGWLCRGQTARLTTCFIVGECDESA
ncbi:hypothetical protein TMEC54S_00276 [Thauera mechernichensis]